VVLTFVAAILVLILGVEFLTPSLGRAREPANRIKCSSNLRQIGMAVMMYANQHKGEYPPTPDLLLLHEDISSECFVCPSSAGERAAGKTLAEVLANFRKDPAHCSYLLTTAGLNSNNTTSQHVLAYEYSANHGDKGMNLLYGDGSAQWLNMKEAGYVRAELEAGHNPPRPRTGRR
jgi:prepilin-type processing-associated H-X9-DG protein